jgi:hypothetical protein
VKNICTKRGYEKGSTQKIHNSSFQNIRAYSGVLMKKDENARGGGACNEKTYFNPIS